VNKPLRDSIHRGHPWLYDRALTVPAGVSPGQVVQLFDERGPFAVAYVDPGSPIVARVVGDETCLPTITWAKERGFTAAHRRQLDPLLKDCTGRRLIHGEGDRCPGLVIDCYNDTLVIVYDGAGANAFWSPRLDAVLQGIVDAGVTVRHVWMRGERGVTTPFAYRGDKPGLISITEGPARFDVDVVDGQKTGFFLDQRENRRLIGRLACGQRVLNLYCYTGGFSVHAALGGARAVTSVDIAPRAIAAVERHMAQVANLPGTVEPSAHAHIVQDGFDFLSAAVRKQQQWDLVIADPPSFAPNEKAKPTAMAAYKRLMLACQQVVARDGLFALASCSSHITESELIDLAAWHLPAAQLVTVMSAASDHPVRPGFPEGRYLKFLLFAGCGS
jgi:23S rRNA (cytosine1962-C5)-methyltransferase